MAQYKNIDIIPDSTVNRIHLSQGDVGRTIIFYLFENALSWSVPASSTIKCQGTKPSGFGFSVSCTYSGNAVTCVTTDEMTDEYGQIEAELVITSSDESQVFGTSNFILDIEKNPHPASTEDGNVETAIALTARITALESAVGDIDDLETEAPDLVGAINEIASGSGGSSGSGLTDDIKQALLQIASKVAYIDDDGQDYYDALEDALYPPAELASITCVYTQSGTVYDTASLNSLKSNLIVTAHMTNSSTSTVPSTAYSLSGTLMAGTSTITVSYGGKTTTFTVTVTAAPTLSSISAVYTQSGTVYTTASLNTLKSDLVVTATYSDSSTATVASADYTLSGTLTSGTSTVTVTYGAKTTTFTVTVTEYTTVPSIAEYDKCMYSDGTTYVAVGACYTNPYTFDIDIEELKASTHYDSENDYMKYAGDIFKIKYVAPNSQSVSTSGHAKWVVKSSTNTVVANGSISTTSLSTLNDPRYTTALLNSGSTLKLVMTLFTADTADSYAYWDTTMSGVMPIGVSAGDIIFAGANTPYYGLHNISEASS